jgi:peptidoglycan LD-endopeptidase CwlK
MEIDKVSIDRIYLLHPLLRESAMVILKECYAAKVWVRYTFTLRTIAEQNAIYAQGRNGNPGKIVTKAKGGLSWHNYGMAIDIALLVDKNNDGKSEAVSWDQTLDMDGDKISDFNEVARIFKAHGWEWGKEVVGPWDAGHFQKRLVPTITEALSRMNSKKVDSANYLLIAA